MKSLKDGRPTKSYCTMYVWKPHRKPEIFLDITSAKFRWNWLEYSRPLIIFFSLSGRAGVRTLLFFFE